MLPREAGRESYHHLTFAPLESSKRPKSPYGLTRTEEPFFPYGQFETLSLAISVCSMLASGVRGPELKG